MRYLTERGQNVNGQPNIIYVSRCGQGLGHEVQQVGEGAGVRVDVRLSGQHHLRVDGQRTRLDAAARIPRRTYNNGSRVAEWLACWTQAQKGLGSNRSRDAVV